jgi:hypothetical protein
MPTVLRVSGPPIERNGITVQPRAMVSVCEDCGAEAHFLRHDGKTLLSYCGWMDGEPRCVAADVIGAVG